MFTSTKESVPNRYLGVEVKTILFTNPMQETIVVRKGTTLSIISSIPRSKLESAKV